MEQQQLLAWLEWREATKQYYAPFRGWPSREMRMYWNQGFSPNEAADAARVRRTRVPPGAAGGHDIKAGSLERCEFEV